jgi:hypothetical protein
MVYLLHSYFGRDGREEAEELLERRSGNPDKPRILGHLQRAVRPTGCRSSCSRCSPTATASTSSSRWPRAGFDPLARTTRFMLTEEAHHMFVGETGVLRVVERTCELMKLDPNGDARAQGGIDLRDDPEVPQLLVLARRSTCSAARCRPTRRVLRHGAQGPRQGGAVRGPRRAQRHLHRDVPP